MKNIVIPTKLTIKVTKEDITKGKINDGKFCPIGCALQKKGYKNFNVDDFITIGYTFNKDTIEVNYSSKKAREFIVAFDKGKRVKPFEFTAEFKYIGGV